MPPKRRTKATTTGKKKESAAPATEAGPSTAATETVDPMTVVYPNIEEYSWRTRLRAAALKNPSNGIPAAVEWLEDFKARLKKIQQNPTGEHLILPPTASSRKRVLPPSARRVSIGKRPRLSGHTVGSPVITKLPGRKKLNTSANRTVLNSSIAGQSSEAASSASTTGRPRRKAAVEAAKRLTTNKSDLGSGIKTTTGRRKKNATVIIQDDFEVDSVGNEPIVAVPGPSHVAGPSASGRKWPTHQPLSPVAKLCDDTVNATRMSQLGGPVTSTPNTDSSMIPVSFHTAQTRTQQQEPSTSGSNHSGFITALPNQISDRQQKTLMEEFEAEDVLVVVPTAVPETAPITPPEAEDEEMPEDIPAGDVSMTVIETVEEAQVAVLMTTGAMPARSPSPEIPSSQQSTGNGKKSLRRGAEASNTTVVVAAASVSARSISNSVTVESAVEMPEKGRRTLVIRSKSQTTVTTLSAEATENSSQPSTSTGKSEAYMIISEHLEKTTSSSGIASSSQQSAVTSEAGILDVSHNDSDWEVEDDGDDEMELSKDSPVCPRNKAIRPPARRPGRRSGRSKLSSSSLAPAAREVVVVRPPSRVVRPSSERDKPALQDVRSLSPHASQSPRARKRDASVKASADKAEEAGRRRDETNRLRAEEVKRKTDERLRKAQEKKLEVERLRQAKLAEQVKQDQAADKHRQDLELQKQAKHEVNRQRALDAEKRRVEESEKLKKAAERQLQFSPLTSTSKPPTKGQNSALKLTTAVPAWEPSRTPPKTLAGASTAKPVVVVTLKDNKAGLPAKVQTPVPQVNMAGIQAAKNFLVGKAGSSTLKSAAAPAVMPSLAALQTTASKEAEACGAASQRPKSPSMVRKKAPSPGPVSGSSSVDSGYGNSVGKGVVGSVVAAAGPAGDAAASQVTATVGTVFPSQGEPLASGATVPAIPIIPPSFHQPSAPVVSIPIASANKTFSIEQISQISVASTSQPRLPVTTAKSSDSTKPPVISAESVKPVVIAPETTKPVAAAPNPFRADASSSKPTVPIKTIPIAAPSGGASAATAATWLPGKPIPAATFGTGPATAAQAAFPAPVVKEVKPPPASKPAAPTHPAALFTARPIAPAARPPKPEMVNYGLDIEQDDDTDDEDRPSRPVPRWAQKETLAGLIRAQLSTEQDLDAIFKGVRPSEKVNLTGIFKVASTRFERRTSSQMWPTGVLALGKTTPLGVKMPPRVADDAEQF